MDYHEEDIIQKEIIIEKTRFFISYNKKTNQAEFYPLVFGGGWGWRRN